MIYAIFFMLLWSAGFLAWDIHRYLKNGHLVDLMGAVLVGVCVMVQLILLYTLLNH